MDQARRVAELLRARVRTQGRDEPTDFGRVLSASDVVPDAVPARQERIGRMCGELRALARRDNLKPQDREALGRHLPRCEVQPWAAQELPESLSRKLLSPDGRPLLLLWKTAEFDTDREFLRWSDQIDALVAEVEAQGIPLEVLDETSVTARVLRLTRTDTPWMLGLALAAVALVVAATLRSARKFGVVMVAFGAGLVGLVGAMGALGMHFNLFSAVVLPSIVGIGIDNAIHVQHARDELGPGRAAELFATRGKAAFLASMTTALGFGTLLMARHHGVYTLGATSLVGVVCSFFVTTVALSAYFLAREGTRSPNTEPRDAGGLGGS